jgi:thioredoxin reductase (NADPH)
VITPAELSALPLFAALADGDLEYLARSVEDVRLVPGEYAGHEGEVRALFVVVEGRVELTKMVHGVENVIAVRLPGELAGEVPMTFSTPLPASMRAVEPSRVLKLDVTVFYTLAARAPDVSATVAVAALERMEMLREAALRPLQPAIRVRGSSHDAGVHAVGSFLHRNRILYETVETDDGAGDGEQATGSVLVETSEGVRLVAPTSRELARLAGLVVAPKLKAYDVVIVGGGPAGLAAAVNAASEGLRTIIIERFAPGGQAATSTRIENYLGFPVGISGDDLAGHALKQAQRLGAEVIVTRDVVRIDPDTLNVSLDGGEIVRARTIVVATGVEWRRLEIGSVDRLVGSGVYYGAARSDAGLAQGQDVFMVGAGNSAGQAALFLSRHARTVTIVARAESLAASMSQYLIDQIAARSNIVIESRSEVVSAHGEEHLEAVTVIDHRSGEITRRETTTLFLLIGANAATGWLPGEVIRDDNGFILTGAEALGRTGWSLDRPPRALETSVPGIFAVGDVRAGSVKRVAAAVGEGGMAVAYVHRHLAAPAGT